MALQNARGTRDIGPAEALRRAQLTDAMRAVFELYGYEPLETPVLERLDILASKYAGGAEILKETFKLTDQGERELALRYDLTVPMCRFIAMNPALKMPFKRYQIAPVFRDGPIKLGRYRQFIQCDVDIVGAKSMQADAEMVMIAQRVFDKLGLDAVIKVNNRKLLNSIVETAGVAPDKVEAAILAIDKLEKVGKVAVVKEMQQRGIADKAAAQIFDAMAVSGTNQEKLADIASFATTKEGEEGIAELQELLAYVPFVQLDVTLARGLAYYTGTVYEAFLKNSDIRSSIAAGGRYDEMIGQFVGNKQEYPAVGISFGLDVIMDAMPGDAAVTTKVFIIPIRTAAFDIAEELRSAGVTVDMDLNERSISKNLAYANSKQIPYVIFVGEQEKKAGKLKLRDMKSGKEEMVSVKDAIKLLS